MPFFCEEKKTAFEAITYAQMIALAPLVFQAARLLRNSGILNAIEKANENGITIDELKEKINLPLYGIRVLIESGLGSGLILMTDEKYTLSKTGYFILNDHMTRVNMDFVHDVCYLGMHSLDESIKNQKPEGLKVFGEWNTVYEALSKLPANIQKSWFAFDHFYSDNAFPKVLPMVFKYAPRKLMDIGGNTGKWALSCVRYDKDVQVTIADLSGQLEIAKENIGGINAPDRISFFGINLLDKLQKLPGGFDAIWMSQFLDCFSEDEILSILQRCHDAVTEDGHVFILEPFWDKQEYEAAAFSLQQTSLYFTAIANGNSRMYRAVDFQKLITRAGFELIEEIHQIGICQSLMICRKIK